MVLAAFPALLGSWCMVHGALPGARCKLLARRITTTKTAARSTRTTPAPPPGSSMVGQHHAFLINFNFHQDYFRSSGGAPQGRSHSQGGICQIFERQFLFFFENMFYQQSKIATFESCRCSKTQRRQTSRTRYSPTTGYPATRPAR